ncbi:efflux RND transporter periplasmic adaptor subunit [Sphingobium scionense]|nr:HlyD family secretion protein [Sphingobium scionense]
MDRATRMTDDPSANRLTLQRPPPRTRRISPVLFWCAAGMILLALVALAWRYAWPQQVSSYRVKREALEVSVSGPATLDAINKANVSSRVAGRLTQILIDRNDRVVPGQLIATIEQEDLRNILSASRANLQGAQGAQQEADANVESAQATLTNARSAFGRQAELKEKGWVSRASYEQAEATLRESEARVAGLRQAAQRARAQTDAAAASVRVDEAQLGLASVRAPFGGIVSVRNRNVGDVLSAGASILEIVDPESIVLTARFDESAIGAVRPGQPARIRFAFDARRAVTGKVLRLGRSVDPETREFTADIVADRLPSNWAINQRANVEIVLSAKPRALVVPAAFVEWNGIQPNVWVLEGGRARRRSIELTGTRGSRLEVRRGLAPGDILLSPEDSYPFMPVARQGDDDR